MWKQFLRRFTGENVKVRHRRSRTSIFVERHAGALRLLIGLAAVPLFVWLFPQERSTEYGGWREGMVAPRDVIAPFDFYVYKNGLELEQERAVRRLTVPPVLALHTEIPAQRTALLHSFLQSTRDTVSPAQDTDSFPRDRLSDHTMEWLALSTDNIATAIAISPMVIEQTYRGGLISIEDATNVKSIFLRRRDIVSVGEPVPPERVMVVSGEEQERLTSFSKVKTIPRARDELGRIVNSTALSLTPPQQLSSDALRALHNLIDAVLVPDLTYNREATLVRQNEAASNVPFIKYTISRDERFIEKHSVLTEQDIDELTSLRIAERERRSELYRWQPLVQLGGRILFVVLLLLAVGAYFSVFQPNIWKRPSWLLLATILVWLPLFAASYVAQIPTIPVYIVPLALTAMLATVLFNSHVALTLSAISLTAAGALLGFNYMVVFVNGVASVVAVFSVKDMRNRNQFMRAMIYLPLGSLVAAAALDAMQATSIRAMAAHVWPAIVSGVSVPVLSMGLLVVFEKLFNITTSMTLLELSDLNSPLLRELSIRTPGTYTHSIVIANLAEKAAEAIGADPLLTRVGAYYHDIGKMQRPSHFTENQTDGRNPHDKLSPQMSALVVAAHVKDGLEIAERVGLPAQVTDFIPQHQGTLRIGYFYNKAVKQYGEKNVDEAAFRYPGPKPQTREAAILMAADAVEAAVRSLKDKTPSRVKGLVHDLLKQRLNDGQFDECALTLKDISAIEESFLPVLAGALHSRIEYPKPPQPPKKAPSEKTPPAGEDDGDGAGRKSTGTP